MMRLDKFLKELGLGSRKEVKDYIRKGLIKVNDNIVKNDDLKINEEQDVVYLKDEKLFYEKFVYIMLNKPQGVISATRDTKYKTVIQGNTYTTHELLTLASIVIVLLSWSTEILSALAQDNELKLNFGRSVVKFATISYCFVSYISLLFC